MAKLVSISTLSILSVSALLVGCSTPPPGNVEMYPITKPRPSFSQQLRNDVAKPKPKLPSQQRPTSEYYYPYQKPFNAGY